MQMMPVGWSFFISKKKKSWRSIRLFLCTGFYRTTLAILFSPVRKYARGMVYEIILRDHTSYGVLSYG